MYKLNLEIFCNNYNDSMIIQEKIMEMGVAVKRLNLEQIDNQEFRGIAQAPTPETEERIIYQNILDKTEYRRVLNDLLEEEGKLEKPPEDFLEEKDMEL